MGWPLAAKLASFILAQSPFEDDVAEVTMTWGIPRMAELLPCAADEVFETGGRESRRSRSSSSYRPPLCIRHPV